MVRRRPSSRSTAGRPAGELAQLGRVDPLAVDLPVGHARPADLGRRRRCPARRQMRSTTSRDPVGLPAAGVERLPAALAGQQRAPDGQVGGDRVLDVEEVALGRAVGADHRRAARQRGADRLGHQAAAVGVAPAVQVGEAGDRHRQLEGVPVGPGDEVGGRLGDVVGEGRGQRLRPRGRAAGPGGRRPCPRRRRPRCACHGRGRPPAPSRCRGRWSQRSSAGRGWRCRPGSGRRGETRWSTSYSFSARAISPSSQISPSTVSTSAGSAQHLQRRGGRLVAADRDDAGAVRRAAP